jgi:NAD(P)-dependent dehydrogenase (short-subunit alcohol dehydrogenase family)
VSDLSAVRAVGERLAEEPVDVLVHNAGVLPDAREITGDGLELAFATHVAGPHLLTRLLAPRLAESPDGRVIFVSSGGMYTQRLDLRDLDWSEREYDGVRAYAQTKRMQVVLAELWAERLERDGAVANSMHPGWADTPAVQSSLPGFHTMTRAILRTPAEGADTVVWLAASEPGGAISGEFAFDRRPRGVYYVPGTREREGDREALWALCERIADDAIAEAERSAAAEPADDRGAEDAAAPVDAPGPSATDVTHVTDKTDDESPR